VNRMVADDVQLREQLEDIEVQFAEAQETSLAM
jgi:hypothetical protein